MSLIEVVANSATPGTPVALTTLSGNGGSITSSATTMLTAGAPLAALQGAGNQFRIVVDSEIMIATYASSTWTLTRGAEGSTAASHNDGAQVWHYLTAGALATLAAQGSSPTGSYSAEAQPFPASGPSLLDSLRKGYNSPQLFTFSTGVNEFDIQYLNGVYYMAYDNKQDVQLIHASTVAGLGTATPDGHIGVTSGTSTARYPSLAYDGTNWHAWVANQVSTFVDHYVSATFAGLASASVHDSWTFANYSDPQIRFNPMDGKWYAGYKASSVLGMLTAAGPNGPWTDLGNTFSTALPLAGSEQADPCPIFWEGRAYMAFAAYDGTTQRIAMVELDPSNSFQAVNTSVIVVSPLETWQQVNANKVFSPIFLANPLQPGQERLYYSQNPGASTTAGWGYVQATPAPADGRRPLDMLRYDGAYNFDSAAGVAATPHSSPTYGPNGLAVTGGSCVSGRLAGPGPVSDFTAEVVFTPTSLPGAGNFAQLMSISTVTSVSNPVIGIWIDNNVVYAEIDTAGGSTSFTGGTTLSTGTPYRVTLRRENGACALYLNGVSQATGTNANSVATATYYALGDNFNQPTPTQPFAGTIQKAALLGEALPIGKAATTP